MSEDETLDLALSGRSLARYGDGELKLIFGGNCVSQLFNKDLAKDLAEILKDPQGPALPCIPNIRKTVKPQWARDYATTQFTALYKSDGVYGSSFITRPDSAPHIDRADYWAKVRKLWDGHDVTLVLGTERSLRANALPGAKDVRSVWGPRRDAYCDLGRIESEIGAPTGPILICLGPAATVLAHRLAKKGLWAIDLGHIGMFMRHAGMYAFKLNDLITQDYQYQLTRLHASRKWGTDGHKFAKIVEDFYKELQAETCLDYGCGEQTLAVAMKEKNIRVQGYDPGIPGREGLPKPCDLVVCTDVLEHIEPDRLANVLRHIFVTTGKGAFFQVACRKAKAHLPDGRNAHLIIQTPDWWRAKLMSLGFIITKQEAIQDHSTKFWCLKDARDHN